MKGTLVGIAAIFSCQFATAGGSPVVGATDDEPGGVATEEVAKPSWESQPDARSLVLSIPAPRGQIVDRRGLPLAQTKVDHYLAIQLPADPGLSEADVLAIARPRIERANAALRESREITDEEILRHYERRRWVPHIVSAPLKEWQIRKVRSETDRNLVLLPTYSRAYPHGKTAAHMVGYVGKKAVMPKTEAVSGDPLWPHTEGRDGLESTFDRYLQGQPGEIRLLFDAQGEKIAEELERRCVPGNHVVTTLDLGMQRLAEETLASHCRRGAFVVLDVKSGDVLAMASRPSYDLNSFIPGISREAFKDLQEDEDAPLFARAFRAAYPPASTFKVSVALAALETGIVDRWTRIPCPGSLKIGDRWFRNWHSGSEGSINVSQAIKRSCNTWFYKVGMDVGAERFSEMAFQLGMGAKTGLPLPGEARGLIPTDEDTREKYGYGLSHGHLANASIGQGLVLASPLQVAQMMAAIANGESLMQVRLVQQVQDIDGKVIEHFPPAARHPLDFDPATVRAVHQGLIDVVHGGGGTGSSAANGFHPVAGKTGTGQWGPPSKRQYVAWFAGFVPARNPKYAFAALYEGRPGQGLSGGRFAAPMAGSFFRKFYGGGYDALIESAFVAAKAPTAAKSKPEGSGAPWEVRRAIPAP